MPKQIAARVAPVMRSSPSVAAPLVWLLDTSSRGVLTLLGQTGRDGEDRVTDEEVKTIIAEAESAGVLESDERNMISGVMRFADRSARGLMTPRRDVEVIDLSDPPEQICCASSGPRIARCCRCRMASPIRSSACWCART